MKNDKQRPTTREDDASTPAPTIVIDTREQQPLQFHRFPAVRRTLTTADYSVLGCEDSFAVERKSVDDLAGCCSGQARQRFERELHRLRGFQFKRLIVVGVRAEVEQHRYRSRINPKSILHSLAAWEVRYDVPIVWCTDADEGGRRVETWAYWFSREVLAQARHVTRHEAVGVQAVPTATAYEKPPRSLLNPIKGLEESDYRAFL